MLWLRNQKIINEEGSKKIRLGKRISSFIEILKKGDVVLLEKIESKKGTPKYILSQIPKVNGAVVVMNPNTGRVLALTGGYQFATSEFNRATQAYKQPGSSFKPFVYLAVLDLPLKPTELILMLLYLMTKVLVYPNGSRQITRKVLRTESCV